MDLSPAPSREGFEATPVATLRRFARTRRVGEAVREYCDLCRAPLVSEHRHLLEVAAHHVLCACDPCALRFDLVVDGRYKLIPRDTYALPDFHLDDAQWDGLALPIDLAFIVNSSRARRAIALYPGPAGATESRLNLSAWQAIVADNSVLCDMQPDVQALLVNRVGLRRLYYLTPIDICYQLVGLIRLHWRGLSGGGEVWREIDGFFAHLAESARELPSGSLRTPRDGIPTEREPATDAREMRPPAAEAERSEERELDLVSTEPPLPSVVHRLIRAEAHHA